MKKTRSDDRDQRAKYGTASVSSFNHGWRNYRFIFSIIFIFATSPFALLRLRLRRFGASLPFSSSSYPLLPVLSHSLHRVPRVMSLIFCSPFLTLFFFFRILLISFYFVLRAQYIPFSLRRRLLASSSSFCIPVVFSASLGSRSFFLGLPASSWFFSFVITHGQYASTKAAARRSGLNVPHRNWKRTW